jgi:hypothetical protein
MIHPLWISALGFTCALMFGPAVDVDPSVASARPSLPQQSFFIPLLALGGALLAVLALPPLPRRLLIGAQLWFATVPYAFPPVGASAHLFQRSPMIAAALLALVGLAGLAWFFLRPLRDAGALETAVGAAHDFADRELVAHPAQR